MPYIKQEARQRVEQGGLIEDAGELNYKITKALIRFSGQGKEEELAFWLRRYAYEYLAGQEVMRYQHLNDVSGALVNAALEYARRTGEPSAEAETIAEVISTIYKRFAVPYEKQKIKENGDIPEYANRGKSHE